MKELLIFIVSHLVDHPEAVSVNEIQKSEKEITLELTVDPSDMGKVIGRQGRIAKAIRTLMKTSAAHDNIRVNVDIMG
ncbi:MAG: KH domain-containing protein [Clostridia bacterium]|nr:KH domain-containing protein [Clostridia bacterium]